MIVESILLITQKHERESIKNVFYLISSTQKCICTIKNETKYCTKTRLFSKQCPLEHKRRQNKPRKHKNYAALLNHREQNQIRNGKRD